MFAALWKLLFGDWEKLRFIKALCDKETPKVRTNASFTRFDVSLIFQNIHIDITYTATHCEWLSIAVWDSDAQAFVYYKSYYGVTSEDIACINYLVDRYHLWSMIEAHMEAVAARNVAQAGKIAAMKRKYLGDD